MAPKRAKKVQREPSSDLSDAPSDIDQDIKQQTTSPPLKRKRGHPAAPVEEEEPVTNGASPPPSVKRGRKKVEQSVQETKADTKQVKEKAQPKAKVAKVVESDEEIKPARKRKATKTEEEPEDGEAVTVKKTPKKRKTKEEKEAEMEPLRLRNLASKMIIGAHVSAAGGVGNAVNNSVHIGAKAFALFLKSQRKWTNPPLEPAVATMFLDNCKKHGYAQNEHVVPHGSYLVNLAATDEARTKQAYDCFLDDLQRCEKLGIKLYNFHPGNSLQEDRMDAIKHLASNLNRAHKETSTVITLLENMAAGGNILGSTFEDLANIIEHVDDKSRVGVCLDTCHAFAGGYDIRTKATLEATLEKFDEVVGLKYLRALHLNDSKAPFQSHRDLHANIGTGFLGLRAFHAIVNEPRFEGLPMVLETPIDVRDENGDIVKDEKGKDKEDKGIWAREIEMLENLVGMDLASEEFKQLSEKLQKMGKPERERIMAQVDKKEEKRVKANERSTKNREKKKLNGGAGGKSKKGKKKDGSDESDLSDLDSE